MTFAGQSEPRQPFLRAPAVVIGLIIVLVGAHVARIYAFPGTSTAWIYNYGFVPARYSHAYLYSHGLNPGNFLERALPFVTVFSGTSGVDVLNAPPEVVAALPGMTPLVLRQFLNDRGSLANDPKAIATALGEAKGNASTEKSQAYRLRIRVRLPNRREATSEVVISLRGDEDPYRVLSWQNDVVATRRAPAKL